MAIQQGGAPVAPHAPAGKAAAYPRLNFAKLVGKQPPVPPGGTDGAHATFVDHNAVRLVVGKMPPPPLTPMQQAQQLVSREITPLQNAITGSYTGMANAGGAAIRQATDAYASALAGEHDQLTQPYTQAETAAAASQDAFANRLTGAGTAASDELAQRLGSIGEPGAVNPVASALAGKATAAGNAVYGTGNATLDQLLGEGAAAEGYASKLPGVARTAGLQQLGQFESGLTANEGKDMLALEEKAPALVQSAYGTIRSGNEKQASITAANSRAAAAVGERKREFDVTQGGKTLDRNLKTVGVLVKQTDASGNLTPSARSQIAGLLGMPVDAISATNPDLAAKAISERIAQQRADISAQTLGERVQHDKVVENQGQQKITLATAKASASAAPKFSASVSRALGYKADQFGEPIGGKVSLLPGFGYNAKGDIVKTSTTSTTKTHGLTKNEALGKQGTALTVAETAFKGGHDAKGNTLKPLLYKDAVTEMEKEGIPAWIYIPALNRYYGANSGNPYAYGPPSPTAAASGG